MVYGVAFSANGEQLLSTNVTGALSTWRLLLDLDTLLTWVQDYRYVGDLTCSERTLYQLDTSGCN